MTKREMSMLSKKDAIVATERGDHHTEDVEDVMVKAKCWYVGPQEDVEHVMVQGQDITG